MSSMAGRITQVWGYDVNPFYADDAKPVYGGVLPTNKPYVPHEDDIAPSFGKQVYIMQIDPWKGRQIETR